VTKSRWYELPFTREESLTADKKVTLFGKVINNIYCLISFKYVFICSIMDTTNLYV